VTVLVSIIEGEFVMCISDNGRGLDKEQKIRTDAFGLVGIHERTHGMQGKCEIISKKGVGTTVIVSIPLEDSSNRQGPELN
jgi:signal transduction histidine kinase